MRGVAKTRPGSAPVPRRDPAMSSVLAARVCGVTEFEVSETDPAAKHHQPRARQYNWELLEKGDLHLTAARKVPTEVAQAFRDCYSTDVIREDEKVRKPGRPDIDERITDT